MKTVFIVKASYGSYDTAHEKVFEIVETEMEARHIGLEIAEMLPYVDNDCYTQDDIMGAHSVHVVKMSKSSIMPWIMPANEKVIATYDVAEHSTNRLDAIKTREVIDTLQQTRMQSFMDSFN